MTAPLTPEPLLTPGEVAALFHVDPKTIRRWADTGRFPGGTVVRTPGGAKRQGPRRYKAGPVLAMRDGRT